MLYLFLFLFVSCHVNGIIYNEKMKSFSHAKKAGYCYAGNEYPLFEYKNGPGVITEQWYTSGPCFDTRTIIRYYIDGDTTPTIEGNLFMMHGIGFYNKTLPAWGTKWIGHTAQDGSLYNTFRIPFQKSIRISYSSYGSGRYWYIVRGVENFPVVIGDITLPSNAKLVLHKVENKVFPRLTYVPLVTTLKSGLIFSVILRGESQNFFYLEGCFGTVFTDADNKTVTNFLSSGTEDMFLSAYYYNKGVFHTDDSGLTYMKYPGTMSAYKFFHNDPVIMHGKFSLLWRVGEVRSDGNCWRNTDDAENDTDDYINFQPFNENMVPYPAKITSYVWTYEW